VNILQVYNRPREFGGEEAVVRQLAALSTSDLKFDTYYFETAEWLGPNAPSKISQAFRTIYNPDSARRLREQQQRTRADAWLFHGIFPVGSPSLYCEALRLNVPVIQYIHNFRPFSINSYLWAGGQLSINDLGQTFRREIRAGAWQNSKAKTAVLATSLLALHKLKWLRAVKAWIATTNFMRDKFIEAGVPAADIFVLRQMWQVRSPGFSRPDVRTPNAQEPVELNPEGNHFLFLGRLIEEKGVKVLCEAWDIVRQRLGASAPQLVIAGNGPLDNWIRERAKQNPLIVYNGPVSGEQKTQLIATCRAMIAPSIWWEPLGLVTYEAYDFAKPMLAARSGGLSETVQHGVTGFLHQPGNATELAEHVIRTNASADLRRQMGEKGRAWLLQQPTQQQWIENFKQLVAYTKPTPVT
jgi:glycosyltransferase involved in cell wall biosynthesis